MDNDTTVAHNPHLWKAWKTEKPFSTLPTGRKCLYFLFFSKVKSHSKRRPAASRKGPPKASPYPTKSRERNAHALSS